MPYAARVNVVNTINVSLQHGPANDTADIIGCGTQNWPAMLFRQRREEHFRVAAIEQRVRPLLDVCFISFLSIGTLRRKRLCSRADETFPRMTVVSQHVVIAERPENTVHDLQAVRATDIGE